MDMLKVRLEFPRNILAVLDIPENRMEEKLREMIALELVRKGRVSSGKAAEIVGICKADFVRLMAANDVSYFTDSPEELAEQADIAAKVAKASRT